MILFAILVFGLIILFVLLLAVALTQIIVGLDEIVMGLRKGETDEKGYLRFGLSIFLILFLLMFILWVFSEIHIY